MFSAGLLHVISEGAAERPDQRFSLKQKNLISIEHRRLRKGRISVAARPDTPFQIGQKLLLRRLVRRRQGLHHP
jgi:hypothetical protein